MRKTRPRRFDESLCIVVQSERHGEDELARLFEQQVFNELAQTAIEDMRETGKSFDELFPVDASDSEDQRKFRERIKKCDSDKPTSHLDQGNHRSVGLE